MEQLPDDMLANVLGRLPPCSLAASRCVRKHWCSIIDARRLLRADLLPLRVEAFFCNSHFLFDNSFLFAPPSVARRIPGGRLDFFDDDDDVSLVAMDHCNGLLLHYEMVVNPATRQWATWPPVPQLLKDLSTSYRLCISLVYDPMVSPNHYEVFLTPLLPPGCNCNDDDRSSGDDNDHHRLLQQEWPPSPYTAYVFSSTKEWRWEERSFIRQGGEAAGTIADMMHIESSEKPKSVYFRRSLYVPCPNNSVMRLSLSDDKYQMIKPPPATESARIKTKTSDHCVSFYLGKSEKGVYSALIDLDGPQFQVWLLSESSAGQTEWVLKCNVSLEAVVNFALHNEEYGEDGPWIINYIKNSNKEKETQHTAQEEEEEFVEWDFENGAIIPQTKAKDNWLHLIHFLGFHPYKEIAFLCISQRIICYHLNNSKVQDLGTINIPEMENAFLYTPCRMGELSEMNNKA